MMRHLTATLLLLMISVSALAQSQELLYELNSVFTINDLGTRFNYPRGWSFTQTESGLYFAPDEASLTLAADGDIDTMPDTVYFTVSALPLSLINQLGRIETLDDAVNAMVREAQIEEVRRIEVGVSGRRALVIVTRAPVLSYTTFWLQGEALVVASLVAPDVPTLDAHGFTWGSLLASFRGVNAQPLETRYDWEDVGLSVAYPEAWQVYPRQYAIAEYQEDANGLADPNYQPRGYVLGFMLLELTMAPEQVRALDYREVADELVSLFEGAVSHTYEDLHGAEERALGLRITLSGGRQVLVAGFIDARQPAIRLVTLGMPSEDDLEPILDTWYGIVSAVRLLP